MSIHQKPTAARVEYLQRVLAYQAPQVWRRIPQEETLRQRVVTTLIEHTQWASSPPIAPTLFVCHLGEPWLQAFREQRGLADAVAQAIHWLGQEIKVLFPMLPTVEVQPARASMLDIEALHIEHENLQGIPLPPPDMSLPRRAYLLVEGTQVFPLLKPLVHIGRRPDNDLVLGDPRVSRRHAQLRLFRGHYMLIDLGSTGGTQVNGKPIRRTVIYPGDHISFAGVDVTYGQRSTRPLEGVRTPGSEDTLGSQSTLLIRRTKDTKGLNEKSGDQEEGA